MNKEILEKVKLAKNPEELLSLAKENSIDLTGDEAKTYFAKLNAKEGELQDDELEDVSGGRKCGTTYYEGHPLVTALNSCDLFCYEYYWIYGRKAGSWCCKVCFYEDFTGLITICTHPKRYDN